MNLEQFIQKYTGSQVDADDGWGLTGECVSLVQRYLKDVFGYEVIARGHAYIYGKTLIKEGIGIEISSPKKGCLAVYPATSDNPYGHIVICLDDGLCFEQWNKVNAEIRRMDSGATQFIEIKQKPPKWIKDNIGWWYHNSDGTYPKSQWKKIKNDWYYFNEKGYAVCNCWKWINNKCYFFDENCKMLFNTITSDGYIVNSNGAWVSSVSKLKKGTYIVR